MKPTNASVRIPRHPAPVLAAFALCLLLGADSPNVPPSPRAAEPDFLTATISVSFDSERLPSDLKNRLTELDKVVTDVMSRPDFTLADLQRARLPDASGKTLGDMATISVSFRHRHNPGVVPPANQTVFDACGVALELLKAKQYSDFLERFMMPERHSAARTDSKTWTATVDSFSRTRAGNMRTAFEEIRSWRKTDSEAVKQLSNNDLSDTSIISHVTNSGGHREEFNIPFRRFEGVWYIVDL